MAFCEGRKVVKIGLICLGVFMMAALIVLAEPGDERFTGGGYDGYDVNSTNRTVIPPPPPKGTVIRIM